jgi:hypothetical protein
MRTVERIATVDADGRLIIQLPPDVPQGEHYVLLVFKHLPAVEPTQLPLDFLAADVGPWPENLSLRREDMYDDWRR